MTAIYNESTEKEAIMALTAMTDLKFMYKEDMVKEYGHMFNIDPETFDFDGNDWEVFLDNMRGITYVDSHDTGYLVQQSMK